MKVLVRPLLPTFKNETSATIEFESDEISHKKFKRFKICYFPWTGVAESKKTELETKMKAVNRAYKVLTDTYSRRSYDAGLYNKSNFADYFDSDTSR